MKICLIWATSQNNVIGLDNKIPWKVKADMQHFKKVTMGCPILMGRKTWESIGRPLPGRLNVVISRNAELEIEGCETFTSIDDAIKSLERKHEKIFVIGGAEIYNATFPLAHELYKTIIHAVVEGDTFFKSTLFDCYYNPGFSLESSEMHSSDGENEYNYTFSHWVRKMKFEELKGKTLVKIERVWDTHNGEDVEVLRLTDSEQNIYELYHDQGCSESVCIESICGDISDIINQELVLAEEVIHEQNVQPPEISGMSSGQNSFSWTFYKLETVMGGITIRWVGESNGYYSEKVDFRLVSNG